MTFVKAARVALTEIFSSDALNACFPEKNHDNLVIYVSPLASERCTWQEIYEETETETHVEIVSTGYVTDQQNTIKPKSDLEVRFDD